jgi:hypothetical protein
MVMQAAWEGILCHDRIILFTNYIMLYRAYRNNRER